ncbi:MAG: zf-HC2 domain-containing protein [Actinomycetota bacterium]
MKKHNPEGGATRYLSGALSPRARRRFEAHLVDCPDCWHEVRLAGIGRSVAEAGRELAPQRLRDRVRGSITIAASEPHQRRWAPRVGATGLVVTVLGVSAVLLLSPRQPEAIARLVADFRGDARLGGQTEAALPAVLGDLELTGASSGSVEGLDIVVHRYRDAAGHRVAVYRSDAPFPVADGADRDPVRSTWHASVDGVEVYCAEDPFHALVLGDDRREVDLAAARLQLG